MASRRFNQFQYSLEKGIVKLYGNLTIGTSGAVSSSDCRGFSIAKTADETGRYTVTLDDTYNEFKGCNVTLAVAADAAVSGTVGLIPVVRNVSVDDSTPTFDLQFTDAAGADADPTSGFVVYLEIVLKNSRLIY